MKVLMDKNHEYNQLHHIHLLFYYFLDVLKFIDCMSFLIFHLISPSENFP